MGKKHVTRDEWVEMRNSHTKHGWSIAKIARESGRSRVTVARVLAAHDGPDRACSAKPHVEARQKIVKKMAGMTRVVEGRVLPKYPSAAAVAMGLKAHYGITITRSTAHRDLQTVCENVSRPQRPFDGDAALKARKEFKRGAHPDDDVRICFSDEHFITTNDHTTKTMWVARGLSKAERNRRVIPRIRKSRYNIPSFMIWACIGVGYRSHLVFIPRKQNEDGRAIGMNSSRYVRTCLSTITNGERKLPPDAIFMQDGARCHTAKSTMAYLARKKVNVLKNWPPYSPDLNPIENLWSHLDRLISLQAPTTAERLKAVAIEVWEAIPQDTLDSFVLSFRDKLNHRV